MQTLAASPPLLRRNTQSHSFTSSCGQFSSSAQNVEHTPSPVSLLISMQRPVAQSLFSMHGSPISASPKAGIREASYPHPHRHWRCRHRHPLRHPRRPYLRTLCRHLSRGRILHPSMQRARTRPSAAGQRLLRAYEIPRCLPAFRSNAHRRLMAYLQRIPQRGKRRFACHRVTSTQRPSTQSASSDGSTAGQSMQSAAGSQTVAVVGLTLVRGDRHDLRAAAAAVRPNGHAVAGFGALGHLGLPDIAAPGKHPPHRRLRGSGRSAVVRMPDTSAKARRTSPPRSRCPAPHPQRRDRRAYDRDMTRSIRARGGSRMRSSPRSIDMTPGRPSHRPHPRSYQAAGPSPCRSPRRRRHLRRHRYPCRRRRALPSTRTRS